MADNIGNHRVLCRVRWPSEIGYDVDQILKFDYYFNNKKKNYTVLTLLAVYSYEFQICFLCIEILFKMFICSFFFLISNAAYI